MTTGNTRVVRTHFFTSRQEWAEAAPKLQEMLRDLRGLAEDAPPRPGFYTIEIIGGTYGINIVVARAIKPVGVSVVNVQQKPNPSATNTGSFAVDWEWREPATVGGNGTVRIRNVAGLTAAQKYNITFGVWYA